MTPETPTLWLGVTDDTLLERGINGARAPIFFFLARSRLFLFCAKTPSTPRRHDNLTVPLHRSVVESLSTVGTAHEDDGYNFSQSSLQGDLTTAWHDG
jgi:hypothetical protein